ncbi:hypothetical protein AJ79_01449 [Helicocarpus griseus UAMH5409]|uniref:Jacalin-type lectin domain-containing protein n=1 Tax=Helicocarpus griseus UAMH5409 TaxID=1447875 RepID=A0A2B7Y6G8_9EURO|nr:hypothetical protein AJ79_01449 [Helicocarpus griseus UAMH5409]
MPWIAPEKLLWEDGGSDRVVSVAAYQASVYKTQYISGLIFTYKSGITRKIGRASGDLTRAITCSDCERLSLLEIFYGRYGLLKITLHFKVPTASHHSSEPQSLVLSSYTQESINRIEASVCHDYIDFSNSVYKRFLVEKNSHKEDDRPEQKLPDKEVIGLWGTNLGEHGALQLGVIFGKNR